MHQHHVVATHLECVDGDHNKYYRTYEFTPDPASGIAPFLVRNWGRRSAPKGQWLRDGARGAGSRTASFNIRYEKETVKNYLEIHRTEFSVPAALSLSVLSCGLKSITEPDALALTDAFERQWCLDVEAVSYVPAGDTDEDMLGWITDWNETCRSRAPARALAADLTQAVLHTDPTRDTVVVRAPASVLRAVAAAFDDVHCAVSNPDDDADVAIIASRLWAPRSTGPYQSLDRAVRDARRLFRRVRDTAATAVA